MKKNANGRQQKVPNYISLKVNDEMYRLVAEESDKRGIPMIDVVVEIIAGFFKRPDIAYVPRLPPGRKRQKCLAESK